MRVKEVIVVCVLQVILYHDKLIISVQCQTIGTTQTAIPHFAGSLITPQNVSYSMIVLYIRDYEGLGFSGQTYHPKTILTWHLGSIGKVDAIFFI